VNVDQEVTLLVVLIARGQLQYTRGSIIPCSLFFSSQDTQAADLISSPQASVLRLVRITDFTLGRKGKWLSTDMDANARTTDGQPVHRNITFVQTATWWRGSTLTDERDYEHRPRRLFGEIHLLPDLAPTTNTPDIKIYVSDNS
jgi:hypothetical protein